MSYSKLISFDMEPNLICDYWIFLQIIIDGTREMAANISSRLGLFVINAIPPIQANTKTH